MDPVTDDGDAAAATATTEDTADAPDITKDTTPAPAAENAGDIAPPKTFALDTPSGMAAYAAYVLEPHAKSGTMPFHWGTWGDGKKKSGFLQSDLILYTFAYHLTTLATIPGGFPRLSARPIGALLLSAQAVQRALQLWQTGVYVNSHKTANHFSSDNWGDMVQTTGPKKGKLFRRATKFVASVKEWEESVWDDLIAAASPFAEVPRKSRSGTASRSGSEAGDDTVISDDDEFIVLSD
ncbi:hypothetical protein FB451DRAFT_663044 [Mycena latifolia]|nr:hypothetical protein FB451DRAFT_663044 [Mycena latifolia]